MSKRSNIPFPLIFNTGYYQIWDDLMRIIEGKWSSIEVYSLCNRVHESILNNDIKC